MSNYSTYRSDELTAAEVTGGSSIVNTSFADVAQNSTVYVNHSADATEKRIVQVIYDAPGWYIDTDNYEIKFVSSTQTSIKKLSSGTDDIKVNIIL